VDHPDEPTSLEVANYLKKQRVVLTNLEEEEKMAERTASLEVEPVGVRKHCSSVIALDLTLS
jgi:hypothetical protein